MLGRNVKALAKCSGFAWLLPLKKAAKSTKTAVFPPGQSVILGKLASLGEFPHA
jgi:hypothetical protein